MTDREKAIVMAYTGICTLAGEKMNVFYQYLAELYGRPVYTHEWLTLDIKEKSKPDFLQLCKEEKPERKNGYRDGYKRGKRVGYKKGREAGRKKGKWNHGLCSVCGYDWGKDAPIVNVPSFCPNCGARMEEGRE